MFADQREQLNFKTNFTKLHKTSIDDLLTFLENSLLYFPLIYKKHFQSSEWRDEREVTPVFSGYLEQKCRSDDKPYCFTHQYPQSSESIKSKKSREVDIEVKYYIKNYYNS